MIDRRQPSGEESERELQLARLLGNYVNRFAAQGYGDVRQFLSENPHLFAEIAGEIQAFEWIGLLAEDVPEDRQNFGDFQIERVAGRGGMGIVYEARQTSLGRRVALKVLPTILLSDPKAVARFYREAKLSASLNHPNIVPVFAMGVEGGTPYFAMEYVEGITLQQLLKDLSPREGVEPPGKDDGKGVDGRYSTLLQAFTVSDVSKVGSTKPATISTISIAAEDEAGRRKPPHPPDLESVNREYCLQMAKNFAGVAEALHYAHSQGVIHRDIKPSNLILDRNGHLRILDFGLAILEGEKGITLSRERVGTPLYMSPEQVQGSPHELTRRTDIYSLGATLYEMLVLEPPIRETDERGTLEGIVHQDPVPLRRRNPRIPQDLENIVLKCLRKKPLERYATAEALAQDLWRFLRGEPVEARPQPILELLARRIWRARSRIAILACIVAAVALASILSWKELEGLRKRRLERYDAGVRSALVEMLRRPTDSPGGRARSAGHRGIPYSTIEVRPPVPSRLDPEVGGHHRLLQSDCPLVEMGPVLGEIGPEPLRDAVKLLEECIGILPESPDAYYHMARGLVALGEEGKALEALSRGLSVSPGFIPALSLRATLLEKARDPEAENAGRALRSAAEESPESWARSWHEAHQSTLRRDWKTAAKAYGKLIRSQSERKEHYLGSLIEMRIEGGLAWLQDGELDGALADFSAAGELSQGAMQPALLEGKVYYLKGKPGRAEETFRNLYEARTGSSSEIVAMAVAETYRELGEFRLALEWLERVPPSPPQLCLKAEVLRHLGDLDGAIASARKAVDGDTKNLRARLALGNAMMAQGNLEGAWASYQEAVALEPGGALGQTALAVCRSVQGDLEGAADMLREVVSRNPGLAQAHYNLGRILSALGRKKEAQASYRQALGCEPGHALALNNLGMLLDLEGDLDAAEDLYRAAAEAAPALGIAHFNLGWACQRRKQYLEAVDCYGDAMKGGLESADLRNNLGACLENAGRHDEANAVYRRAIEIDPKDALSRHGLGVVFEYRGDHRESEDSYREAVSLAPGWSKGHNDLGLALLRNRKIDGAESEFRKAIDCDPENVWAFDNLARLILQEAKPDPGEEALPGELQAFEDALRLPNASSSVLTVIERWREAAFPRQLTFASVDALFDGLIPLIDGSEEEGWRFHPGRSAPSEGLEWTAPTFADAGWSHGKGFLDPSLASPGEVSPTTVFMRRRFSAGAALPPRKIWLRVRLSDGFVAYLNGAEVARNRAGAEGSAPSWTDAATGPEQEPWSVRRFPVDPSRLRNGENVLSLVVLGSPGSHPRLHEPPSILAEFSEEKESWPRARKVLEAWRSLGPRPEDESGIAYFEGRLFQSAGRQEEAERAFRATARREPDRPEPLIRLQRCLRAIGEDLEAERCLRGACRPGATHFDRFLEAWFQMVLADLCWNPKRILESFPVTEGRIAIEGEDRADDFRWLARELAAGQTIRINCGGGAYRSPEGARWGKDRFYLGGIDRYLAPRRGNEGDRKPHSIYSSERSFWLDLYHWPEAKVLRAYRIPLPPGQYRVSLHFTETEGESLGRQFDVMLEEISVLERYRPPKAPETKTFTVRVGDGALDIAFGVRGAYPQISAIEIEKL